MYALAYIVYTTQVLITYMVGVPCSFLWQNKAGVLAPPLLLSQAHNQGPPIAESANSIVPSVLVQVVCIPVVVTYMYSVQKQLPQRGMLS